MSQKIKKTYKKRKNIQNSITAREMVDLRLSGLSFQQIAKHLGATKTQVYAAFREFKCDDFDGYAPIPLSSLTKDLASDSTYSQIAHSYGLSVNGLKNHLTDRGLHREMNLITINRLRTSGKRIHEICDYYGITRNTLLTFRLSQEN